MDYNTDEYFLDDNYQDSNADNFEGEDGEHYYYLDGIPFADIDGTFQVGDFGTMHSNCAAKVAYEEFKKTAEPELEELYERKEWLEDTINEYSDDEDTDTEEEEDELYDINERIEYIENALDYDDCEQYFNNYLDSSERENWILSLGDCGRIWLDGNGSGVIAFWNTPGASHLSQVINDLNNWAESNNRKIDFNNFKISVGQTGSSFMSSGKPGKMIPVKNYAQEIKFRNQIFRNEHPDGNQDTSHSDQIRKERILHMLPASQKWRATADARDTINHKNGQKLTMSNGKEMPMAQYHSLIYQSENKSSNKKILNEMSDLVEEYYDDYDNQYILDQFFSGKNKTEDWGPLIDPAMYQRALNEFTSTGRIERFPAKYIYQWMGICIRNASILEHNTQLCGHANNYNPSYDFAEYLQYHPNIVKGFYPNAPEDEDGNIDEDFIYDNVDDIIENCGFYDWVRSPGGHGGVTDYGLPQIWKIIGEYDENSSSPEETLVLINRILDCYHGQGELSDCFIKGGDKTLSQISSTQYINEIKNLDEIINRSIKNYINERVNL